MSGHVVAHLVVRLRERGPAEAPEAGGRSKLHQNNFPEPSVSLTSGVTVLVTSGTVTYPDITTDPGALTTSPPARAAIDELPAVDRDVELAHRLAQRRARVEHVRAVAGELRGVHPVAAVLDVAQPRGVGEDEVRERLAEAQPRHRAGVHHALDRLLADARRAAGDAVVRLRDHADVRDGEHLEQRPRTAAARHEAM